MIVLLPGDSCGIVNKGYSDISFIVENQEMRSIKSILIEQSPAFEQLINRNQPPIRLNPCVTKIGFMNIMTYFGYGAVDINDSNIIDILYASYHLSVTPLFHQCIYYIEHHQTLPAMKNLLEIICNAVSTNQNIIFSKQKINSYFQLNGYKLLLTDEIYSLSYECVLYLLKIPDLVITKEINLLKKLVNYEMVPSVSNSMHELFSYIQWKEITLKDIISNNLSSIKMTEMNNDNTDRIYHIYIEIPCTNPILTDIFIKFYCSNMNPPILKYEELKLLENINICNYLKDIIQSDNPMLLTICFIIIIDMDLTNKLSNFITNSELSSLIYEYQHTTSDHVKLAISKCLLLYINPKSLSIIYNMCGVDIIVNILPFIHFQYQFNLILQYLEKLQLTPEQLQLLSFYKLHNSTLTTPDTTPNTTPTKSIPILPTTTTPTNSNNNKNITNSIETTPLSSSIITPSSLSSSSIKHHYKNTSNSPIVQQKQEKQIYPITSFLYDKKSFVIRIYSNFQTIPQHDGNNCKFSITPNLPEGLQLCPTTGKIFGIPHFESPETEYTVICSNEKYQKTVSISIIVKENKYHFNPDLSFGSVLLSNNLKVITNATKQRDDYCHCFLNMEMKKGVYHITYQSYTNNWINLGASKIGYFQEPNLGEKKLSYSICLDVGTNKKTISYLCGDIKNEVNIPEKSNEIGAVFEIIYDMDKRLIYINHDETDEPILLWEEIESPLYPYVELFYLKDSVALLSVYRE